MQKCHLNYSTLRFRIEEFSASLFAITKLLTQETLSFKARVK